MNIKKTPHKNTQTKTIFTWNIINNMKKKNHILFLITKIKNNHIVVYMFVVVERQK
jgi:hypothetical protein